MHKRRDNSWKEALQHVDRRDIFHKSGECVDGRQSHASVLAIAKPIEHHSDGVTDGRDVWRVQHMLSTGGRMLDRFEQIVETPQPKSKKVI